MTESLQREWVEFLHHTLFPQQMQFLIDEEVYHRRRIRREWEEEVMAAVTAVGGKPLKDLGRAVPDSSRAQIKRVTEGLLQLWRSGYFSLPTTYLRPILERYGRGIQCVWIASGTKKEWAQRETIAVYADEEELRRFMEEVLARLPCLQKVVLWHSAQAVSILGELLEKGNTDTDAREPVDADENPAPPVMLPQLSSLFMWHCAYTPADLLRLSEFIPPQLTEIEVEKKCCVDWEGSSPQEVLDAFHKKLRFH